MATNSTSLSRRAFLTRAGAAAALLPVLRPFDALAAATATRTVTILHTNDMHSRIDPFPADAGRNAGLGGFARRQTLVNGIRKEVTNHLLFDSGDYFQGTPYFNLYKGKLEIELMSRIKYDAVTLGNHDFDAGMDVLAQRMSEANFPFLICNYTLKGTAIERRVQESLIFNRGGLKIGVYGVGINLDGLAPTSISSVVGYRNPVEEARRVEADLKAKGCDLIICLSHLGIQSSRELADPDLAQKTRATDLILGGHTHTFLDEPREYTNEAGRKVLVNQVGWAGIRLGRLDYRYEPVAGQSVRSSTPEVK
jgi:5'-nucleotidase